MEQVMILTPKEYERVVRNATRCNPRLIVLQGARVRVQSVNVIGVYYHRGPKVLSLITTDKEK